MTARAFDLIHPETCQSGVVFAAPHSGRDYGAAFLAASQLNALVLRSSEDAWVDQLIAAAPEIGVPLLLARKPRAYVDLNRGADELDPALIRGVKRGVHNPRVSSGLGVIPRVVANGRAIYPGRISREEAEARLASCWHPYHRALAEMMAQQRQRFGKAILVDCHSMPHEAIAVHARNRGPVAEVVLGDRFGAACDPEITETVERVFLSEGLRVARNAPFAGAFISKQYGRPAGDQHVIQIEIDRSLYMNEATLERHRGFDRIKTVMTQVIREVTGLAPGQMPLAAE